MTNSLKDYEEMFKRLSLSELEVQEGDFKLKIKKEGAVSFTAAATEGSVCDRQAEEVLEPVKATAPADTVVSGTEVKAPLLGVYYGAVGDKKAVEVGDKVEKGDVLCTLEAMKMMNEVKAPVSGTVVKVLAAEGDLVEFDQVLFVIG